MGLFIFIFNGSRHTEVNTTDEESMTSLDTSENEDVDMADLFVDDSDEPPSAEDVATDDNDDDDNDDDEMS